MWIIIVKIISVKEDNTVDHLLVSEENVVTTFSKVLCSTGTLEITVRDVNQQGVEYGAFAKVTRTEGAAADDGKADDKKKDTKEITDAVSVNMLSGKAVFPINGTTNRTGKKYLLRTPKDNDNQVAQRYLKAMGFNVGASDCKDCTAYGPNTTTYNCAKKFKCIDGSLGVASASALIIFQSRANPANPYAQKTGEPNVITGVVDKITLEAFAKNFTISKLNADIVGFPNFQREDIIKDWQPVKYETIANETLSKELTVYFPCMKKDGIDKAVISPSVAVAWAMLVQGAIDTKKLKVNNLKASGPNCGFRSYLMQVKMYFEANLDVWSAAKPYFDKPGEVSKEYRLYLNNKNGYDFENKTKKGGVLSGRGKSNHGKCRAIDFVAGGKERYILLDGDCPNELRWLNDNAGRYGFSGFVELFQTNSNPLGHYKVNKGFFHFEVWHWDYLEEYRVFKNKKGIKYTAQDCFIKEKREELLK